MGRRLRTVVAAVAVGAVAWAGAPAVAEEARPDEAPRVERVADGTVTYVDPALSGEDVERVRGELQVVVVDGTGPDGRGSRRDHAVEQADGTLVPVDLDVEGLTGGSTVVADLVAGPGLDAALEGEPAPPVAVESAAIEPVAAATTVTPSAHRAYVAVVANTGSVATTAQAAARVDAGLAWWAQEAEGGITSFTRPSAVATFASTLTDPCGFNRADSLWDEAASRFPGVSFGGTSGNHLVVLVGSSCGAKGTGLGTLGSSLSAGGEVLMLDEADIFTATLVHELGHNVGLEHANMDCSCADSEYWDLYSPMALAISGSTYAPASLDGEFRDQLGITTPGEVADVATPGTSTHVLQAKGSATGLRSLRVVAPDGAVHWVEARLGGGRDAASFTARNPGYSWGSPPFAFPLGVTVSTDVAGAGTPSLLRPRVDGTVRRGARTAGQSFTQGLVTVSVDAVGAASATVTVTIAAPLATLSTATPTIIGTRTVGRTLTARVGTWTTGTTFTYQWKANAANIRGATGRTLRLTSALRGKKIRVVVTGRKAGYVTAARTSAYTAAITG